MDKSGFLKPRRLAVGFLFLLAGLILAAIIFSPKSPKEEPLRFIGLTNDFAFQYGPSGIFRCRAPGTSGLITFVEWERENSDKVEKITVLNDGTWRTNIEIPRIYLVSSPSPGSPLRQEAELRISVPLNAQLRLHYRREFRFGLRNAKAYKRYWLFPWTKAELFGCEVMIKPD